jgi:hypothetical protein
MSYVLNPWPGLQARPPEEIHKVTVRVPRDVANDIERVFGGAGFITGSIHTILKVIHARIKRDNKTTYDPEYLFTLVRRLSTALVVGDGPDNDVAGAAQDIYCGTPAVPHEPDPQSTSAKRATQQRRERKAATGKRRNGSKGTT